MATAVIMPKQGQSVESCLIGKWYKNKGDKVSAGDILFTYETDKATFEEESKVDGIMLDIFFDEGDDVECFLNVCVIGKEGESTEEFKPVIGTQATQGDGSLVLQSEKPLSTQHSQATQENRPLVSPVSPASDNVRISPRARRLAEKTLADLRYAVPTGANGRIIERDVQAVLSSGHRSAENSDISAITGQQSRSALAESSLAAVRENAALAYGPDVEIVALTNVRKFIAKAMHASLMGSAQLTSHSSFDASDIFAYRKKLKEQQNPGAPVATVTDIVIYAASRVLLRHKSMNAHFLGDKIALFSDTHIGVAVDTPRGLLVPTVFNANTMSLQELSAHTKELFEKCKSGSVEPDLLKGASFTISNLGGLGIEMFTPILNPPQTGILGVCNVIERLRNGKPYPALGLSITYDHQAMDGADSARFLKDLIEYLESFSSNLPQEDE